jgi:uncharacterized protein YjbI with pentapeptide repeats
MTPRVRLLTTLAVLAFGAPQAAGAADRAVARLVVFSGPCAKCELSGRNLAGVRFIGADFSEAAFVGSDLREAQFLGSSFHNADFSRADLSDAEILGADFVSADLSKARLSGALMSGSRFASVSFRNADLSRAVMTGSVFTDADFSKANLRGALIAGADLSHAGGLRQDQIDEACGDARTKLPGGLTINVCTGMKVLIHPGPAPRHLVEAE